MENSNNIKNPKHYNSHPGGYECWDVVGPFGYFIGNAMKYLWRCGLKDGANEIEDLKKAIAFIEKEIKNRELQNKRIEEIDKETLAAALKQTLGIDTSKIRSFICYNCGDTGFITKSVTEPDGRTLRHDPIPCPSCQPPAKVLHPR